MVSAASVVGTVKCGMQIHWSVPAPMVSIITATLVSLALVVSSGAVRPMPAPAPSARTGTVSHASPAMEADHGTNSSTAANAPLTSTGTASNASPAPSTNTGTATSASPAATVRSGTTSPSSATAKSTPDGTEPNASKPAPPAKSQSQATVNAQLDFHLSMGYAKLRPNAPLGPLGMAHHVSPSHALLGTTGMACIAPYRLKVAPRVRTGAD